jgi:hypothetical protein
MEPKIFAEMSLSELVKEHNAMATSTVGQSCGLKPVQSFRDKATAVRRCTGAEVRIRSVNGKEEPEEAPRPAKKAKVRKGTHKERLIKVLLQHPPKTLAQMAEAVYGDATKVGAIGMVLQGVNVAIKKGTLPYTLAKLKTGRTTVYALVGE